jgi:hypothetical protein
MRPCLTYVRNEAGGPFRLRVMPRAANRCNRSAPRDDVLDLSDRLVLDGLKLIEPHPWRTPEAPSDR